MLKDLKVLFISKLILNIHHVVRHFWTDAGTGSKKITCYIHLSRNILVCYLLAILVGKCKWLDQGNSIVSLDPFPDHHEKNPD